VQKAPFQRLVRELATSHKQDLRFQRAADPGDPGGDGVVRRSRCFADTEPVRDPHTPRDESSRRTCSSHCAFAASAGPSRRRGRVPDGGGVTITGAQEKGKREVRREGEGERRAGRTDPRGPGKPAGREEERGR
jgi:hypothetical protein